MFYILQVDDLSNSLTILQYEVGAIGAGLGGLYLLVFKTHSDVSSRIARIEQFLKDKFKADLD